MQTDGYCQADLFWFPRASIVPFVQNQRSPLTPPRGALQLANSAINADHHVPKRGAGPRA